MSLTRRPDRSTATASRARSVAATLCLLVLVATAAACSSTDEPSAGATSTTAGGGGAGSTTSAPASGGSDGSDVSTTGVTVAPHGELPTLDLTEAEQAYVDALMAQPAEGMDQEQTRCIAAHVIQGVGVEAIEASGVTAADLESGAASINDIAVDEAVANEIVDAYETCEFDLVQLVSSGFAGATGGDPTKTACIERVVTPELARRYMVLAITGMAQGGSPELIEIQRQIEPCLT